MVFDISVIISVDWKKFIKDIFAVECFIVYSGCDKVLE